MGFSVSGAFVIVFFGALVAFSGLYTVTANSYDRVDTASDGAREAFASAAETDVTVTDAEVVNATSCTVRVNATNDGSTTLSVDDTDLLVDGQFRTDWEGGATVDGDAGTDLWLPEERLSLTVDVSGQPERAKLVTETGVAGFSRIDGGSTC